MVFKEGKKGYSRFAFLSNRQIEKSKRSQVTIFVIIALVIVAIVAIYFGFRGKVFTSTLYPEFKPVEESYLSCIQNLGQQGILIMETQGGWIDLPDFESGSVQNPFSSQLNFQGQPVPYWYYTSGNSVIKEQVPKKTEMARQLEKFISDNIDLCDFSEYRTRGFSITNRNTEASVSIDDYSVSIDVTSDLQITLEDKSSLVRDHSTSIASKLGKFYGDALNVYAKEKSDMFLENYGVDVLRLYAPVDGIVVDCAPKIWNLQNISDEIKQALEANYAAVKTGSKKDYFTQAFPVSDSIRFMYSRNWPSRLEVWPADSNILIANPVGLQAGLGALGFCYVPYHFVYDLYFPVLVQIYDDDEIFQFPVAIVIDKNMPRNALTGEVEMSEDPQICNRANTPLSVYTYDSSLNPVEAKVSVKCLDETCIIGTSKISGGDSFLRGNVPQCANAIVYAEAEGYVSEKQIVSTVQEGEVNLLLNKKYENNVVILIDGKATEDTSVVNFISDKDSGSVVWPQQNSVKLSEGSYDISVYAYRNSSIYLAESSQTKCISTARTGLLGLFGATDEKCFDIKIPGQKIENVIVGGGKAIQYFTESELKSGTMVIRIDSLPIPSSIDDVQKNYETLEDRKVYVEFK